MIKRFAQCLREYKWTALVSPVCMIGEVAMEVTIPLVMADLYDYGIAVGNMTVVWQKALQLLICAIVSLMFGVMSANYASKAATGFARNLRHDMYYKVQDFDFANIDKFSTASIVTPADLGRGEHSNDFPNDDPYGNPLPHDADSGDGQCLLRQPPAVHYLLRGAAAAGPGAVYPDPHSVPDF